MTERQPEIIALTGGIGSGKSTVAALFAARGARIIDADLLAREVVLPGMPALEQISAAFGPAVLAADGTLNRRELAAIIFADAQKRAELEAILHPRIREAFSTALQTPSGAPLVIYVAPLFFESKNPYPEITRVVLVAASETRCLERVMARDKISSDEALLRIRSQMPLEQKKARANWVIDNESTPEALLPQVEKVYSELVKAC